MALSKDEILDANIEPPAMGPLTHFVGNLAEVERSMDCSEAHWIAMQRCFLKNCRKCPAKKSGKEYGADKHRNQEHNPRRNKSFDDGPKIARQGQKNKAHGRAKASDLFF